MKTLDQKRVIITGGATGIGYAVALLFAYEGATVAVLTDKNMDGARHTAEEISGMGGRAIALRCDVSREVDCQNAVREVVDAFGGLDILVNNAGIYSVGSVLETTLENWEHTMAVNVGGVFLMSKYAIPVMAQCGGGAIVNIASDWGLVGGRNAAAYCASKGAVVLLTRSMSLDHADHLIRVNCVCPGDVNTPMVWADAARVGQPVEEYIRDLSQDVPLGRICQPDDVARAILYLASDASAFVTGTHILVDGGITAGY
jgi:NAD(P)-dependent dehydrogenase (short-subunit alcohol dehydrogenase family)